MNSQPVELTSLDSVWEDSTDHPLSLFKTDDPPGEAGSFVIRSEERVPEQGWTSHRGDELSLILEGELTLVTREDEYILSDRTLSLIPSGVDHYSVNKTEDPVKLVYFAVGNL